jgi:hypothetical protein
MSTEAAPVIPAQNTQEQPALEQEISLAEALGINPDAEHLPDSDEARILAAIADVDAEAAAEADTASAAQQPDATQQQPDQTQRQQPNQPTVPVAAVQAERKRAREAEIALAEEKGKNAVLTDLVMRGVITPQHATAVQEGRAQLAPQHQQVNHYADLNGRQDALAQRYEDGEITHTEWVRQNRELEEERKAIDRRVERQQLQERAIEESKPAAEQIETVFPSLEQRTQDELQALAPLARINAQRVLTSRGAGAFDPANPEHLRIFHFHVAHLQDQHFNGGRDFAAFQASRQKLTQGIQPNPSQTTPNAKPSRVTTPTPGRVTDPAQIIRDKVNLSQRHPPDLTGMNDRNASVPTTSEQQIVNMTTEDIAKMPKEWLNQQLGLS